MRATVDRGYSQFYAENTGELMPDRDVLAHEFTVERALTTGGYRLVDSEGHIHPFVPAEFVTIVSE